jgi:hypothetical protein
MHRGRRQAGPYKKNPAATFRRVACVSSVGVVALVPQRAQSCRPAMVVAVSTMMRVMLPEEHEALGYLISNPVRNHRQRARGP